MYGFPLILSLLFVGGLIAYVGDKIGMKVGKNRLSLCGLRPKYSSIIITIITGILIAFFSLGLMMAASEKARIAVFRLDELLVEIEKSKAELSALRANKIKLEQEADNLAHNLKLFGKKYFLYLNQEVIYKKGAVVSELLIEAQSPSKIKVRLNNWLQQLQRQENKSDWQDLKYDQREFDKLINILANNRILFKVKLVAANNIFKGNNLVVKFDARGVES